MMKKILPRNKSVMSRPPLSVTPSGTCLLFRQRALQCRFWPGFQNSADTSSPARLLRDTNLCAFCLHFSDFGGGAKREDKLSRLQGSVFERDNESFRGKKQWRRILFAFLQLFWISAAAPKIAVTSLLLYGNVIIKKQKWQYVYICCGVDYG
nr:hypothetical protein Iba_chr04dCG17460 [Ipomoea batatas]